MTPGKRANTTSHRVAKAAAEPGDAADDQRFTALCKALAGHDGCASAVAEYMATRAQGGVRRFGANGLRTKGKIFAMMAQGTLVVKLPAARVDAIVSAGNGERFDPGHGRIMKEWVALSVMPRRWPSFALEACEFVTEQLGKPRRRRSAT
jgi:hypothetical protein